MKKKTLGHVLKKRRESLGLTQRALALKLNVKPSHVAYLENDQRRPSLALVSRLADVMGLEKEPLFLLAHPEAHWVVGERRGPSPARQHEDAWRKFVSDRATLTRHKVTDRELKVLHRVSMLGRVSSPNQFLFILNAIRQAVEEE